MSNRNSSNRMTTNLRESRHKSIDLSKNKLEESEIERLQRFEELTRAIRENDESNGDGTPTEKSRKRLSLLPAQSLRLQSGFNKRHTINLASTDIDELSKALDKDGKRVLKMGEMLKRSDILKKWKPRFFVAREDKFIWFKSMNNFQMGGKPEGSMVYKQALVDLEDVSEVGRENVFSFNSRGRACYILPKDQAERDEWVAALKKIVREN